VLWLVAAALAFAAACISYYRGNGFDWRIAAAGLFCAVFGVGAWVRHRPAGPNPTDPPRA
jgi:hypothetical protein